jgi:endonuclease I
MSRIKGSKNKIKAIVDAETYNQQVEPNVETQAMDSGKTIEEFPEQKSVADFNKLGRKQRKQRVKKTSDLESLVAEYNVKAQKLRDTYYKKIDKLHEKIVNGMLK